MAASSEARHLGRDSRLSHLTHLSFTFYFYPILFSSLPIMAPSSSSSSSKSSSSSSNSNILALNFNQDASCVAVGTRQGYRIVNCEPFGKVYSKGQHHRFNPHLKILQSTVFSLIRTIEVNGRTFLGHGACSLLPFPIFLSKQMMVRFQSLRCFSVLHWLLWLGLPILIPMLVLEGCRSSIQR